VNFDDVAAIADAVLYEGYALYPYRASSLKNQVRFTSGGLYPAAYSRAQTGADACSMRVTCLLQAGSAARITLKLRCLEIVDPAEPWQRVCERDVTTTAELGSLPRTQIFELGRLRGSLTLERPRADSLSVRVDNDSPCPALDREAALPYTLIAAHLLLGIEAGEFVSLLEPPDALGEAARQCRHDGLFPVLIGRRGARDRMLASPIILYDYPATPKQSPGDLFDATEIDEILSLRILTMTAAEKDEARRLDPRVRALLDRTEGLGAADFAAMHGLLSKPRSQGFKPGDRVRLRPKKGGDVFDLALAGRIATVRSVEQDFEDRVHLSVTVDDDPGQDLGIRGQPGHRFFFGPDEVEPLEGEAP
jgi:hypothetical protein